jgi:8-oxo-dGTP pyrophosphatase MutT (NUDIX family)
MSGRSGSCPAASWRWGETPEQSVRREVAEELGLTIAGVAIIDSWVYEITPVRHVFVVSYGTRYTGDEELARSAEHKELGLFAYDRVPGLPMPEPYKTTIARWRRHADAGRCCCPPSLSA